MKTLRKSDMEIADLCSHKKKLVDRRFSCAIFDYQKYSVYIYIYIYKIIIIIIIVKIKINIMIMIMIIIIYIYNYIYVCVCARYIVDI